MAATGVCFSFRASVYRPRQQQRQLSARLPPPSFTPSCSAAETKRDYLPPFLMSNSRPHSVFAVKSVVGMKGGQASGSNQSTKPKSIVCADCDGNGAIQCTQCKGDGVNAVDHFNGRFKAGALCWLCRGKREILCGNCNGAGFVGGFLSTQDD